MRNNRGGDGGSGIVIIRYLKTQGLSTFNGTGVTPLNSLILSLDAGNPKSSSVEVLVVAGGGGGGMDMGGGGGGGGVVYRRNYSAPINAPISVTVGAGGAGSLGPYGGGQAAGSSGADSIFGNLRAFGGGGGGSGHYWTVLGAQGQPGGSGGGDSTQYGYGRRGGGASGIPGQGYKGGGQSWFSQYSAGGGGGAGQRGGGGSDSYGGKGGQGFLSDINGTSLYWGGGGGGSGYTIRGGDGGLGGGAGGSAYGGYTPGSGGGSALNAGANGVGQNSGNGGNGGANTGGGGGGGTHWDSDGGNGGSGIVIVRYFGSQRATGGTITTSGGYTIHTFTSSGTFTPTGFLNIFDLSQSNNLVTLANGAVYESSNMGGIVMDGNDDKIIVSPFTYTPRSLSIWLYNNNAVPGNDTAIGGPSTYQTLTSFGGGTPGVNLGGWTGSASNEAVHIWGNGTLTYTNQLVPVGFHNFVFNWNGSNYDIWIDGIKQTVLAGSGGHAGLVTYTNANVYIGSDNNTYEFNGKIFKYDMYNISLTDAEVQQNFQALRSRYGI
jgi:hypothetical protein